MEHLMSLLIHPGFHKTGTTWLQQQLFSDTGYFHSMFSHEEIDSLFVRPHDLEFCRDTAEKLVSERRSNDTNGGGKPIVDVISSEILSGLIFTGSHTSKIIAERLAECCGGAKILFTVRAQKPITRSIYFQYIKRGGRLDIEDFLTYRPEPGYGWFNPSVVAFDLLVRCYADLFGADNVLVLPQELLARDRNAFVSHIMKFAGGDGFGNGIEIEDRQRESVSPPASSVWLLRLGNLFREGPVNPNAIGSLNSMGNMMHSLAYSWKWGDKAAKKKMDAIIAKHMTGQFGASNRRLQAFCPVDLASLGYEMAD